jgi:hypothetical protein
MEMFSQELGEPTDQNSGGQNKRLKELIRVLA